MKSNKQLVLRKGPIDSIKNFGKNAVEKVKTVFSTTPASPAPPAPPAPLQYARPRQLGAPEAIMSIISRTPIPTASKFRVTEEDRKRGPAKYIADALTEKGVDLSKFYHWGVHQSRLHRAQLISGYQRNPVVRDWLNTDEEKLPDILTDLDNKHNGEKAYANKDHIQKKIDQHDHYVGTMRVIQAYRLLSEGKDPSAPEHWGDLFNGEKNELGQSRWQYEDPFLLQGKKILNSGSASPAPADPIVNGFRHYKDKWKSAPVGAAPPVDDTIKDFTDHVAKVAPESGYPREVKIPEHDFDIESLLGDPFSNYSKLKATIFDTYDPKEKMQLAKTIADSFAEDQWKKYCEEYSDSFKNSDYGKLLEKAYGFTDEDFKTRNWQKIQENGPTVMLVPPRDGEPMHNDAHLSWHEVNHSFIAQTANLLKIHEQAFKMYIQHHCLSDLVSNVNIGKNDNESLKYGHLIGGRDAHHIASIQDKVFKYTGSNVADNPWTRALADPVGLLSGHYGENFLTDQEKTRLNMGTEIPKPEGYREDELSVDGVKWFPYKFKQLSEDIPKDGIQYPDGDPAYADEKKYNEIANKSKTSSHRQEWKLATTPDPTEPMLEHEKITDKKGFLLQWLADRFDTHRMILHNMIWPGSGWGLAHKLERFGEPDLEHEYLPAHVLYGKFLSEESRGAYDKVFEKALHVENDFYKLLYENKENELKKAMEHALIASRVSLSFVSIINEHDSLISEYDLYNERKVLSEFIKDEFRNE